MDHKLTVSAIISRDHFYLGLKTKKDAKWGIPGGKVEPGENLEKALQREMREEIGTDVIIKYIVGIYYFKSDRGNAIMNFVYTATPQKEPHIVRPDEIELLEWLTFPQWKQYERAHQVRAPRAQITALENYCKGQRLPRNTITDLF